MKILKILICVLIPVMAVAQDISVPRSNRGSLLEIGFGLCMGKDKATFRCPDPVDRADVCGAGLFCRMAMVGDIAPSPSENFSI